MQRAAIFASGRPVALETKGTVREARGLTSSTYTTLSAPRPWMANCTFIRPTTLRPLAISLGLAAQFVLHLLAQRERRQRTGRIAGMHARLFDVLHDAADDDLLAVAQGVDIDLGGIVEEAVEQHRAVVGDLDGVAHVALEILLFMHDFHGAAAQHVGRAHHQRIADFGGKADGVRLGARRAVGRLLAA